MSLGKDEQPVRRRRRGPALESALLDAAWQEIVEHGYDGLTYEGVAARASTSRAVVYRRWPTRPELAQAAVLHGARGVPYHPVDTGTLRGDLRAHLLWANGARISVAVIAATRLGGYFAETGTGPGDLRELLLDGRAPRTDALYANAVARGELDPARLTPRVRALAFDLFRAELLMTLRPVAEETIDAILDEVVMPLLIPPVADGR
ncbi:TetR/AcrR family transcriptional regulator [Xylanimonas allomyrinae]|uniref:TetR/AcrR family transcriptional regulator n=1 Tax=Xylanimonas allomyrinae TaxID=2509459 RepID=A0A4P6EK47_9MICO|nr:TetR/AcrR family transcriptional regulator [Xylanimonas allomyrinae]QAY62765.1 TetR/AcrR family transcriptional regulator [Xylanimonas allomyrinae]